MLLTRLLPAAFLLVLGGFPLSVMDPAAAQAAETIRVQHAQGETDVPANPKTVLVFDLAALDTLDVLGIPVAGVPDFKLPGVLTKYASDDYAKIGSLFEPDFEAVNALRPDLIIVGGRSAPKYEALSKIAPTIDLSTDPNAFMESVARNARTIGRVFGKEDEAEALLTKLNSSMADLRKRTAGIGTGLVVLTTGNRMSVFGPASRFGILHTGFGFAPAVTGLDSAIHGEAISFEFILEANPDWLLVVDRDAAIGRGSAAKILDNDLVAQTKAWKQDHVIYLDPTRWYLIGGGLRALQQSADFVAGEIAKKTD